MARIFKYITQIFVVKEREMEIGLPTDVKHVAHIGWDGRSDSAPSWMTEFKNPPDFSTLGHNNTGGDRRDSSSSMTASHWASQDFEQSMRQVSTNLTDLPPTDLANVPKKSKRKKVKSSSSSSSSSRSSRPLKTPKATYTQRQPTPNLLI